MFSLFKSQSTSTIDPISQDEAITLPELACKFSQWAKILIGERDKLASFDSKNPAILLLQNLGAQLDILSLWLVMGERAKKDAEARIIMAQADCVSLSKTSYNQLANEIKHWLNQYDKIEHPNDEEKNIRELKQAALIAKFEKNATLFVEQQKKQKQNTSEARTIGGQR